MSKQQVIVGLFLALSMVSIGARAAAPKQLQSPSAGVVCDSYFCADRRGVSTALTTTYLGKPKGARLAAEGEFDRPVFTFANGIYCDSHERVCRKDRYFGADGKPSGAIDTVTTRWLFGR